MDATAKGRARDLGMVRPIIAEITLSMYERLERFRRRKRWTKRTVIEEALERYLKEEEPDESN